MLSNRRPCKAAATLYLLRDGHGSTTLLVSPSGQIVAGQVYRYDAFGNAIGFDPSSSLTNHLYNSEPFLSGIGLYDYRDRLGDPLTGRFLSLDRAPQSLHKYLFCHNDPINYADPSGLFEGLVGQLCTMTINTIVDNMDRLTAYTVKQAVWASLETDMEVIIGNLIGAATGIPFDADADAIAQSFASNFASNMLTSWLGGDKWNRLRQLLDFSVRTLSDVWLGGQNVMWSAGLNLASLGVSELLTTYGTKIIGACIKKYGPCFAAGTPVVIGFEREPLERRDHLSDETGVATELRTIAKPIEQIKVGDVVLSAPEDDLNGPFVAKRVEEVFERSSVLFDLHVGGKLIRTTAEHPFYVQGKGWTAAKELSPGDLLRSHDGQWVAVESASDSGEVAPVYNMRVEEYHTYFVGADGWGFSVWAHNACRVANLEPGVGVKAVGPQVSRAEAIVLGKAGEDLIAGSRAEASDIAKAIGGGRALSILEMLPVPHFHPAGRDPDIHIWW